MENREVTLFSYTTVTNGVATDHRVTTGTDVLFVVVVFFVFLYGLFAR